MRIGDRWIGDLARSKAPVRHDSHAEQRDRLIAVVKAMWDVTTIATAEGSCEATPSYGVGATPIAPVTSPRRRPTRRS